MIKAVNEASREAKSRPRSGQQKTAKKSKPAKKIKFRIDEQALKRLKLVAVAYSHVEREWFPTEEAYQAEIEVETRTQQVVEELQKLGITAKGYPGDQYFFTNLIVDDPDLVLNLNVGGIPTKLLIPVPAKPNSLKIIT